jgi:hypothetical protein
MRPIAASSCSSVAGASRPSPTMRFSIGVEGADGTRSAVAPSSSTTPSG